MKVATIYDKHSRFHYRLHHDLRESVTDTEPLEEHYWQIVVNVYTPIHTQVRDEAVRKNR